MRVINLGELCKSLPLQGRLAVGPKVIRFDDIAAIVVHLPEAGVAVLGERGLAVEAEISKAGLKSTFIIGDRVFGVAVPVQRGLVVGMIIGRRDIVSPAVRLPHVIGRSIRTDGRFLVHPDQRVAGQAVVLVIGRCDCAHAVLERDFGAVGGDLGAAQDQAFRRIGEALAEATFRVV